MTENASKLTLIALPKTMKMKINQDKSITFNFQSVGYKFEVTPLFFAKFQEVIGLDIKPLLAQ